MRAFTLCRLAVGLAAALLFGPAMVAQGAQPGAGPACRFCQVCPPSWTATVDAVFLKRSDPDGQPLLFDPFDELLNAGDLNFGFQEGARISLTRHSSDGACLEFSCLGITSWESTAVFGTGLYLLAADRFGGPVVRDAAFNYQSSLNSAELNVRQPAGPLSLLAGIRWIQVDDDYGVAGTTFGPTSYTHTIAAENDLYGFQIGADAAVWNRGPFRVDAVVKAGVYFNSAEQQGTFDNPGGFGFFTGSAQDNEAAYVGEAGLTAAYKLNKAWALRAGYQVLCIDGVALATEQIPMTGLLFPTTSIDTEGSPFYHGAHAGVEFMW